MANFPTQNDPMRAVPLVGENVEVRFDEKGLVHLRKTLVAPSNVWEWLFSKFGYRRSLRINLDPQGSYFWRQIDGDRDLKQISSRLSREFKISKEDGRKATFLFTHQLMKRFLIVLKIQTIENEA